MKRRASIWVAVGTVLVFGATATPKAATYQVQVFDVPGTVNTQLSGVNSKGHLVGTADGRGFLWKKGRLTWIDYPGALSTHPTAINDKGQIVGWYIESLFRYHAFLLDEGQFTNIEPPNTQGGEGSKAFGINNRGMIVGQFQQTAVETAGFLLKDGCFTAIMRPGQNRTILQGINSAGQITGQSFSASYLAPAQGFVFADGVFSPVVVPASLPNDPGDPWGGTWVFGIDDALRMVGTWYDHNGNHKNRGFVLAGTELTYLDVAGAEDVRVLSSNTAGTLVGYYLANNSSAHGLIWTR